MHAQTEALLELLFELKTLNSRGEAQPLVEMLGRAVSAAYEPSSMQKRVETERDAGPLPSDAEPPSWRRGHAASTRAGSHREGVQPGRTEFFFRK